jgi:hypothetical protein
LPPVDEANREPEFLAFRDRFRAAVKERNAEFVIGSSAPHLQRRFAGWLDLPKSAFAAPAYEAADWRELERAISLGGAFTHTRGERTGRREFCAPYVYATYPEPLNVIVERMAGHDENPESAPWPVLGERVPVYALPSADSRVLTTLSYHLVIPSGSAAPGSPLVRWYEIFTPTGQAGWISADLLRSPSDYHACFAQVKGAWTLVEFMRDRDP